MPRYKYTAKDLDGKTIRGEAEAPGEDELYEQLREGNKMCIRDRYYTWAISPPDG